MTIQSKASTKAYQDGWDRIFGKKESSQPERVCAKIQKSAEDNLPVRFRRIGGPRYWCTKSEGHPGECGDWKWGTQAAHALAKRG